MASDDVIERIVKLLRQAASSDGTIEGDNAAARAAEIARRIMDKHGVQVILGDAPPEEQPRAREVLEDFGVFESREIWLEEIAHCVGWLYDSAPVWYWTTDGRVGLVVFDDHGDQERLHSAKEIFDRLLTIIHHEPMPRFLRHNVDPIHAQRIFRAGMAHALTTRLSRIGQVPRLPSPELPSNDAVVALVPIHVHRRPRHAFVDSTMNVPVQGGPDDWAQGSEAALFVYGVNAGQRVFLPQPEVPRE
jgi:hypothetical protein